jgi:hypothetical protein
MALTAVPVGFIAGLFGIGGGLVMVPFLFYVFESLNIDAKYIMHLSVGTSFGIIIPTSIVSVMTHYKLGAVDTTFSQNLWYIYSDRRFFRNYFCSLFRYKKYGSIFFISNFFVKSLSIIFKRKRNFNNNFNQTKI